MKESINLKEIQRQLYLFYAEDGLVDLAVGLVIAGFGLLLLADLPGLVGVLGIVPLLIWYIGKRIMVLPRIGSIQPTREMRNRFRDFFISLALIGLGLLVFFLISPNIGNLSLTIFGLVLGLGISSLGVMLQARRFYLYGVLVFLAMAIGEYLGRSITVFDPFLAAVIAAGGIIFAAGLVYMIRFLGKYPVVEMEG
jgi:hypothetical protein